MIGRRASRPVTFVGVLILTSPLVLGLAVASGAAVADYVRARQFDDWWSRTVTLRDAFAGHTLAAFRTPHAMVVRQRLDPTADDPIAIRLRVSSEEWDGLVADPFLGDNPWVDATVVRRGQDRDVRVRRRGDTSVHWTTPKTSFTLRAPKGERVRGFRELALSGKTVLASQIANTVPAELGVRAPFTAIAPVYLNERYYGLFRAVEPIDESFLRRQGWMPGDVFRADVAERGEYYKNQPRNVFLNPYVWDRVANGTAPEDEARGRLAAWLATLGDTGLDAHRRVFERVDREATAKLFAAMLLAGDPYHMSGVHNQFWYDDPVSGKLVPVPWDLRLLDLNAPATNPLNDLFGAALRDPFLPGQALEAVHGALSNGLAGRLEARLDSAAERFAPHLAYEGLRRELVSPPGDPEEIRALVSGNIETLTAWTSDARAGSAVADLGETRVLDIETRGFAGLELVGLRVAGADPSRVRLFEDRDLDGLRGPGDREVAGRVAANGVFAPLRPIRLHAAWRHEGRRFEPGRVHYRFFLDGVGGASGDVEIEPILSNRITGAPVTPEFIEPATPLGGGAFHAWRFEPARGGTVRLSGAITLDSTLRLSAADTLVIEPGASLRLSPDVSIVARGPVFAEGTAAAPISLAPAEERRPWGAFALQGDGADGSRVRHVRFEGGGGATEDGIVYKGMVTVHGADDVRFEDVVFEDNMRSDDALNAVHSEVHVSGCRFSRANGDAIDYDYSTGTIESCLIEDSRNDAIDLMTSDPLIRSNRLLRSGDKGVSIGEDSAPVIVDNLIADGERGIEIKDRSEPVILHDSLSGNAVGILSAVKNWRYAGGGRGLVALSRISGNDAEITLDGASRLASFGSAVGTEPIDETATPRWISAAHGLAPGAGRPGPVGASAVWIEPLRPVWSDDFGDDTVSFYEDAPGWRATGRLDLARVDGELIARIERGDAAWSRAVEWDLPRGGELVLEGMRRDVRSLEVVLSGPEGEVRRTIDLPDEAPITRPVTVPVPAGRWTGLRFEATANDAAVRADAASGLLERRGGRVDLHRLRLFPLEPQAGEGS